MSLFKHIRYTLLSVWFYAPGVITIFIGYFLLTKLTQGQDVVMLVGEAKLPVLFTAVGVILWAFFVWYCSRLIGYEKRFNDVNWPLDYLSLFPRLLAYNTFVVVQTAIIALPTVGSDNSYLLWAFVFLQNAYYFILQKAIKTKDKVATIAALFIAALYTGYLVFLYLRNQDGEAHEYHLPWMALLLFGLQILVLYFFILRRVKIDQNAGHGYPDDAIDYVSIGSIKVIKVPAWLKAQEKNTFLIFNIISGLAIALYFVVLNSVWVASQLGPLPVVLLAFGILAGLATIITYLSMRVKFNLFFVLLVIAIVVGNLFDPYSVKLTKAKKPFVHQQRPSLEAYLAKWIQHRKAKMINNDSLNPYRVYLVLADGGASRSGYWAASVLAAIQQQSLSDSATNETFNDHLLALSGASGGSVGNAVFYSLLKKEQHDPNILQHAREFLGHDFLTYTIAHYLGSDLAGHFIPGLRDRATALSNSMDYWSTGASDVFKKEVDEAFDQSGRLPILFINTTRVQEGTPAVVSSIRLDSVSNRLDVLSLIDSTYAQGKGNIQLSTAAVLGARFPYVSPAGGISYEAKEKEPNHSFVDGGYFDNSGGGIIHEMMQRIEKIQNDTTNSLSKDLKRMRFYLIHLTNTPDSDGNLNPIHPLTNDLAAPLLTVFNTYGSQTTVNDKRLETFMTRFCNCTTANKEINLYRTKKNESYPMNWVISQYRKDLMDARVDEVIQEELKNGLK
ncbi:MAG: hypothetical protein HOP30_21225 [Cyclobacteriaceae bacterium]|nr:hypothetical protein [Cyclobacteriaceae bacterium]